MIEFGTRIEGVCYIERPSAYAIIRDASNAIALVKTRKGYFLPGGGVDPGEDLACGLRREIIEELGYQTRILDKLGAAVQHLYDVEERVYYRKVGHFFRANLTQRVADPIEKDHELTWCSPRESVMTLAQEFQAWAIRQAFHIADGRD
jgi:8-oxo-dGTP diphosphatase